jgi:hypothetical protein
MKSNKAYHLMWVMLLLLAGALSPHVAVAQRSMGGTPASFSADNLPDPSIYVLPVQNNEQLKNNRRMITVHYPTDGTDSVNHDTVTYLVPAENYYGWQIATEINMTDQGTWEILPNQVNVWRLRIKSINAYNLQLHFGDYHLEPGASIFIYNPDHSVVRGAFTDFNNSESGSFITAPIPGDELILEYNAPVGLPIPTVKVTGVIHDYMGNACNSSNTSFLSCNETPNCPHWQPFCNAVRSTVQYEVALADDQNFICCSGVLMNNTNQDFTPYILTARHCMHSTDVSGCRGDFPTDDKDLSTALFFFNNQSATCDPIDGHLEFSVEGGCSYQTISDNENDIGLIKMNNKPPIQYNVFYAGWDLREADHLPNNRAIIFHHPEAGAKEAAEGTFNHYFGGWDGQCFPLWWREFWDVDLTTGSPFREGSSGGPMFTTEEHVIGVIGGEINSDNSLIRDCSHNNDYRVGRLIDAWSDVRPMLDPHWMEWLNPPPTQDGIDPIMSCQNDIFADGNFWPAKWYRATNPQVIVQAANTITVAQNGHTFVVPEADYVLEAQRSIHFTTVNRKIFHAENGCRFKARITDQCEPISHCGVNYNSVEVIHNPFVPDEKAGVKEENLTSPMAVNVYPNPFNNQIVINYALQEAHNIKISLVNSVGINVKDITLSRKPSGTYNETVNTSGLAPGIYMVQFCVDGKCSAKSVVKVNE